jgi:hypothetical protein
MSEEKDITIKQILDWCLKKTEEGSEVILQWDGGGDSGWVHLEVDGEDSNDPEAERLIDMMYDQLDYGSWAGEFSASGEAPFDPETQMFQGTDYYTETDTESVKTKIEIRIPKHIHFDDIDINTQDEECNVDVTFGIRNGFDHPETESVAKQLSEMIQEKIVEAAKLDVDDEDEIDGYWGNYQIFRTDFTEEGNEIVYILEDVEYSRRSTTENYVEIDLKQLLEDETE